ncbi:MAG TPA: serine/threonine-protein kinase [Polyangiaceae bacterium]|nr:serine/threonine-protein kinase [Polyangiaceae bacterium]
MPALSSHPLPEELTPAIFRGLRTTPITSVAGTLPRANAAKAPRAEAPKSKPRPRPPLLAGRYSIDRYFDRGGTSKVYLGWDELCEEEVVIKILTDEAARCPVLRGHFLIGSRAALLVEHENVVRTLAVREPEPGTPYMVMELLRGELMADLLFRTSQLPCPIALSYAAQTAAGLAALHRTGIVHCDIKPDNLFLTGNEGAAGELKILDFGLAEVEGQPIVSEAFAVRGTAQFMAPEQVLGDPVDARTDVYSLGVVMFRMLTGQLPFDLKLSTTLLRHQLSSPTPPPSWLCDELAPNVEGIVLKAMRKNPANRYASALELCEDLQRVREGHAPRQPFSPPKSDVYVPQSARAEQAAKILGFSPAGA